MYYTLIQSLLFINLEFFVVAVIVAFNVNLRYITYRHFLEMIRINAFKRKNTYYEKNNNFFFQIKIQIVDVL